MREKILNVLDVLIFGLVALFTNQFIVICHLFGFVEPRKCEIGQAYWQIFILVIISCLVLWLISYGNYKNSLMAVWRKNKLVVTFIFLAALSILWSKFWPLTLLRVVLLLLLSFIASYLGVRFSVYRLLNFIAITFGVFALASLFSGIVFPDIAIMSNEPYVGLWRGIFWHKVYLGAEMALGYIACLVILLSPRKQYSIAWKIPAAIVMAVCVGLILLSDSASGFMVFVIQTCLIFPLLLWLLRGHLISRTQYLMAGILFVAGLVFLLFNLDFVFGLFNRSVSMTGRVPLWSYLVTTYVAKRPLFGYGVGTFWYQPGINQALQAVFGWGYGIGVSDNGYMDILLGLGGVGLVLFLAILAAGFWRSLRVGLQTRELVAFFPAFVLVHIFFINISLSYFLESESFIWFLLACIMFLCSRQKLETAH